MSQLNPENRCSHLYSKEARKDITIQEMFTMQRALQDYLASKGKALDLSQASFKDKVGDITVQMRNLTTEFAELLERLPYKEWKSYSNDQLKGWLSEENRLETLYEYIDMFHFFLNIGLCLGIDGETFIKLYATKNAENFDRQARGY
jgi:dimeric dUTPase (all-alpha-NTP-PPase superfamily)